MHGEVVDAYRAALFKAREQGLVAEPLYDGVADLLRSLYGKGWLLGVATGKSDRGLNGCLVNHGIFDLFVTLQTADRHPSKPDPSMLAAAMADAGAEPGDTVMIGDTASISPWPAPRGAGPSASPGAITRPMNCWRRGPKRSPGPPPSWRT